MVQIFHNILRYFDVPLYSVICKRKEGQGKHNWLWNNDILIPWKCVPDVELRCSVVEIKFVDGSSETIEPLKNESYTYDTENQLFKVPCENGYYVMFPREFVKSIRYVEV